MDAVVTTPEFELEQLIDLASAHGFEAKRTKDQPTVVLRHSVINPFILVVVTATQRGNGDIVFHLSVGDGRAGRSDFALSSASAPTKKLALELLGIAVRTGARVSQLAQPVRDLLEAAARESYGEVTFAAEPHIRGWRTAYTLTWDWPNEDAGGRRFSIDVYAAEADGCLPDEDEDREGAHWQCDLEPGEDPDGPDHGLRLLVEAYDPGEIDEMDPAPFFERQCGNVGDAIDAMRDAVTYYELLLLTN